MSRNLAIKQEEIDEGVDLDVCDGAQVSLDAALSAEQRRKQ